MEPDEPNDEERQEELSQDQETPFQPANPNRTPDMTPDNDGQQVANSLDTTHPMTDTNIDAHEQYDEGVAGAAEAAEPNAGSGVGGYSPPNDDETNETGEEAA